MLVAIARGVFGCSLMEVEVGKSGTRGAAARSTAWRPCFSGCALWRLIHTQQLRSPARTPAVCRDTMSGVFFQCHSNAEEKRDRLQSAATKRYHCPRNKKSPKRGKGVITRLIYRKSTQKRERRAREGRKRSQTCGYKKKQTPNHHNTTNHRERT